MQLLRDIISSSNSLCVCILVVVTLCTESKMDNEKEKMDYKGSIFSVEELLAEINYTPIISVSSSNKQCESQEHAWNHNELSNYSMWYGPKSSSTILKCESCSRIVQEN